MPLDDRVLDAICEATREQSQPSALADKVAAWLEALAEGNETLEDRAKVATHLELLFETTTVTNVPLAARGGDEWLR